MATSPKKRQSNTMRFLQMTEGELNEFIQQELATNPALTSTINPRLPTLAGNEEVPLQATTKPGSRQTDFTIRAMEGILDIELNAYSTLSICPVFSAVLTNSTDHRLIGPILTETIQYVQQKLYAARTLIKMIETRRSWLMKTMNAILHYQHDFFTVGDLNQLKPMVLDDIARYMNTPISRVSRAIRGKRVRTEFGVYPLKYFFSVGIGQDGRSRRNRSQRLNTFKVKTVLAELIQNESKAAPLTDTQLQQLLTQQGYLIARRTVAKYREASHIPIVRQRREY